MPDEPPDTALRCYVSYSHSDKQQYPGLIERLVADLLSRLRATVMEDVRFFTDEGVQPGEAWARRTQDEISTSDVIIPIISASHLDSGYLLSELRLSQSLGRGSGPLVLPLLLGQEPARALPEPLRRAQVQDLVAAAEDGPSSSRWRQFVKGIASSIAETRTARLVQEVTLLLAAPADMDATARSLALELEDSWNREAGAHPGSRLSVRSWRHDLFPGGAQDAITTPSRDDMDVVVAVFGHQVGNPWTSAEGRPFASGPVAEVDLAFEAGKPVYVYAQAFGDPSAGEPLVGTLRRWEGNRIRIRQWRSVPELVEQVTRDISRDVVSESGTATGLRGSVAVGPAATLPGGYVPRKAEGVVRDAWEIKPPAPVWLFGMGGVGKTSVAKRLTQMSIDERRSPSVTIWVPHSDAKSTLEAYAEAGLLLRAALPGSQECESAAAPSDTESLARFLLDHLGDEFPWIVVLDDAHGSELIEAGLIPAVSGTGRVIIASREMLPAAETGVLTVNLGPFTVEEAASYVRTMVSVAPTDPGDAVAELCEAVGTNPAVLATAVATINATSLTVGRFLKQLSESSGISATSSPWESFVRMALDGAGQGLPAGAAGRGALAAALTSQSGHPMWIWGDHDVRAWVGGDETPAVLSALERVGLLSMGLEPSNRTGRMHSLFASAILEKPTSDPKVPAELLLRALTQSRLRPKEDIDLRIDNCLHILEVTAFEPPDEVVTSVLRIINHGLKSDSLFRAYERLESAMAARGDNSARLLVSVCVAHAQALEGHGRLAEASTLLRRALYESERELIPDHPTSREIRMRLAFTLTEMGDYDEATTLYRTALESMPPGHPALSMTLNNFSMVLKQTGRFQEAVAVLRHAVSLGSTLQSDILVSLRNLATLLRETGQDEEAVMVFRAALANQTALLGPDHPDTLATMEGLASALISFGSLEEAEATLMRATDGRVRSFGPDHPTSLADRETWAGLLARLGRTDEAEAEYKSLLYDRTRVLGNDHPDTLKTRANLVRVLTSLGHLDEAIRVAEVLRSDAERILGPDHPWIAQMRSDEAVARTASAQGGPP